MLRIILILVFFSNLVFSQTLIEGFNGSCLRYYSNPNEVVLSYSPSLVLGMDVNWYGDGGVLLGSGQDLVTSVQSVYSFSVKSICSESPQFPVDINCEHWRTDLVPLKEVNYYEIIESENGGKGKIKIHYKDGSTEWYY